MSETVNIDGEVAVVTGGNTEILHALEKIYERDGDLQVRAVVEEARDENSPLHGEFTWEDDEAAERWREVEARNLIRRFKLEIVREDRVIGVNRYTSVEVGNSRAYRRTEDVAADENFREAYRRRVIAQLEQFADKLRAFEEFSSVVVAIEAVTTKKK